MKKINIGSDFSEFPVGRFRSDGPDSGQRFREDFLEPALSSGQSVIIEMSGTDGYGSSFLDEAFGGIIRLMKLSQVEADRLFKFEADPEDQSFIEEVKGYIKNACADVARSK